MLAVAPSFEVIQQKGWQAISVSTSRFKIENTNSSSPYILGLYTSLVAMAKRCLEVSWCMLMCRKSDGTYLLSNIVIDFKLNDGPIGTNNLRCWTQYPNPSIFPNAGVTVAGFSDPDGNVLKVPANLIDGIYGLNMYECAAFSVRSPAYLVFDLGQNYAISAVYVNSQSNNPVGNINNILIQGGLTFEPANFSSYSLIGYFNESIVTYPNYRYTAIPKVPVVARFLSLSRMNAYLQPCHLGVTAVPFP